MAHSHSFNKHLLEASGARQCMRCLFKAQRRDGLSSIVSPTVMAYLEGSVAAMSKHQSYLPVVLDQRGVGLSIEGFPLLFA